MRKLLTLLPLIAALAHGQVVNIYGPLSTSNAAYPTVNPRIVNFATDADHSLVAPEMYGSQGVLKLTSTGSLTATHNLTNMPLVNGFSFTVINDTTGGQSIVVKGNSGTFPAAIPNCSVSAATCAVTVATDGVNYYQVGSSGGSSGFPIVLGSTSVAAGSTTTAIAGLALTGASVNGVTPSTAGPATQYLDKTGAYSTPSGYFTGTPTVAVTGTPTSGQVLTATSGSAATFQNATSGGSPIQISIATACASSGAQADLNTGLTPAGGAAGDYGACINTQAASATATNPIELLIDGAFKASGVALPNAGNVTLRGQGGGMNRVLIVSYSISGNVVSFVTKAQSLQANNTVMLGSFGTSTFFNAQAVKVSSTGLSSTGFQAAFTHGNVSTTTEAGEADYLWGTGLVAAAGTNNDLIHNGAYTSACATDPGTVTPGLAPGRGSNIIVTDMVLNGWGATLTGANGNSTFGNRQGNGGTPYSGPYTSHQCTFQDLNIRDMENVKVDNVFFFNAPAHNIDLSNVGHATVSNSQFESQYPNQPLISTDGIHVNGPSNDLLFTNNTFRVGEDFALNAPEGWSGLISGVTINGVTDDGSNAIMRAYAGSVAPPSGTATAYVNGVTASNIVSIAPTSIPIIIGAEVPRTATVAEAVTNIRISDSVISSPYGVALLDNYGSLDFANVTWQQSSCNAPVGFISTAVLATTGDSIGINGLKVQRTSAAGNCVLGAFNSVSGGYSGAATATTLGTLSVSNFGLVDQGGSHGAMGYLYEVGSGSSIATLNSNNIDWTNITAAATGPGLANYQTAPFNFRGPSNQTLFNYIGGGGAPIANQNLWDCLFSNNVYECRTINDANTAANPWLLVSRTGYVPNYIQFGAPISTGTTVPTGSCSGIGYSLTQDGVPYFCNGTIYTGLTSLTLGGTGHCATFQIGTSIDCPSGAAFLNASPSAQMVQEYNAGSGARISDQNLWDNILSTASMSFRMINDANSAANTWLTVSRSGYVPTTAAFYSGMAVSMGALTVAGSPVCTTATGCSSNLGGTPTIDNISFGAGAGTSPSALTVSGTDGNHQITFTTGTTPSGSSPIFTMTFTASRGHVTYCTLSQNFVGYTSFTQVPFIGFSTSSATSYQLEASTLGLAGSTPYSFNVNCP